MIFLLFDGELQIGTAPDVDAAKRMRKIFVADNAREPEIYVKIGKNKIEPWGEST